MEKKSGIVGMPLMAIKEGMECGKISQLIVDVEAKRVTHLLIGGVLGAGKLLPVGKLMGVGRDFLTIASSDDLAPVWSLGEAMKKSMSDQELTGLNVVSSKGNVEGKVADFAFDVESGTIEEYYLAENATIAKGDVLTIAARALFVNFKLEPVALADAQKVQPQVPANKAAEPTKEAAAEEIKPVVKEEPAKVEPVKAEPAKAEPVKAEPVKAEPAKAEPAKAEPAKGETAKAEPVKAEPAKAEPAKEDDDEGDYFTKKQSEFLVGRTAGKDILAADGSVLIKKGETITKEMVKKARSENKLTELLLNV
ncbi:hypothetical protein LJC42_02340 [Eubacteriales bacterium OttesenSCG-928-K08]|nr:hypothetical protein [Eubacteriales bacterium OttesenSCG-928-K08]